MSAPLRALLVLAILASAGCTAPEEGTPTPTPTATTQATAQPTATPPTSATPTPATPTDGRRALTGVEGETRYSDRWDAGTVVPKLEADGFTVIESDADGALLRHGGNETPIEVRVTDDGTALRMRFNSEPREYAGDSEELEQDVDARVAAATPRFEEVAMAFEEATGWERQDTLWVPLIQAV